MYIKEVTFIFKSQSKVTKMWLTVLLFSVSSQVIFGQEASTPSGKVKGEFRTSLNGRKYSAFEGIPYAKPPVEDLRFERSVLIEPWSGSIDATKLKSCIQFVTDMPGQDEDCLYLNVYVPSDSIDPGKKYDVVVHIHGGGFMLGAGYVVNAKYMMDKDYIVVTVNYRLGPFGFISTEDEVLPGNDGLKDQNLALIWIKQNIASFGGNPDSITLTGMSAGAASAQLHFVSQMSRGLFHKAMSHGGSTLNPWVIKENPLENAKKLATLLDCPDSPTSELKKCLKTKPSSAFVEVLGEFLGYGIMPIAPFAPVVEKTDGQAFLSKQPYQLLKEGDVIDVPYIISSTTNEGLVLTGGLSHQIDEVDKKWLEIAHFVLDYNYTLPVSKREEIAEKIKTFYLGAGNHITKENFMQVTQMVTDRIVTVGTETSAKLLSKAMSSPVYYYVFNYLGENNRLLDVLYPGSGLQGICHTDDAIYFYGFLAFNEFSAQDKRMWEDCQDMLYMFASTGVAKFEDINGWDPTKDSELDYLKIDGPGKAAVTSAQELAPISFWSNLGFEET